MLFLAVNVVIFRVLSSSLVVTVVVAVVVVDTILFQLNWMQAMIVCVSDITQNGKVYNVHKDVLYSTSAISYVKADCAVTEVEFT